MAELPIKGQGQALAAQGMYDADKDTEDVWITTDLGKVVHCWYRPGKGWSAEVIYTP